MAAIAIDHGAWQQGVDSAESGQSHPPPSTQHRTSGGLAAPASHVPASEAPPPARTVRDAQSYRLSHPKQYARRWPVAM
ncbi:hypothetical protein P154DRAFT_527432 [Amniculicola lignicola CBS 123094]|uniref:Uncharacterized protein n=1 Tax=Amniculicola lignicola CBS 123094 TaxID=1392246 RepID=A0A6A5W8E0_9PLEO|nr:hypothetical protein P154DRAFT_527432 [Amniculicola lignicola CBS 123094]